MPRAPSKRFQNEAENHDERDVDGVVQVALALPEIGRVQVEEGEGDSDHRHEAGEDRRVAHVALREKELQATSLVVGRHLRTGRVVCDRRHRTLCLFRVHRPEADGAELAEPASAAAPRGTSRRSWNAPASPARYASLNAGPMIVIPMGKPPGRNPFGTATAAKSRKFTKLV